MVSFLPLLAEFLGTFLLVLSVLASGGNAFVIGGTLALVILLIGTMSGAHVNPAISLAMFIKGSLSLQEFFSFVVVQLVGATASLYAYNAFA
jgi:aquaporin Z